MKYLIYWVYSILTVKYGSEFHWSNELEKEFKETIKKYFDSKIKDALKSSKALKVGNQLAKLLRDSENDIVEIITPRPLAGSNFASWVKTVLNKVFQEKKLPLLAVTSGEIKQKLNRSFTKNSRGQGFKPDIDIVVVNVKTNEPLVIISAKTTLAERVMQTISWHSYLQTLPDEIRNIKLYLVTAWETFSRDSANRERVQQLDGIYVCNPKVQEWGKIKIFSKILNDLKALL